MADTTIRDAVIGAVVSAVSQVAQSPATSLQPVDVRDVSKEIQNKIAADPVVQHVTNTEPWYQSKVTLGAIVSIAMPLLGLLGVSTNVLTADQLTGIVVAGGTIFGGLVTLWGRWKARKPIGS